MANLQYIGARYVPTFANPIEWDNVRSYEPLTIVTYYGTSYTSKKSVPPGVALSNTEFWAVTGNYNAQVAQIQNQITELSNAVTPILPAFGTYYNVANSTILTVAKTGGMFTDISSAVTYAKTFATWTTPVAIFIGPGEYTESINLRPNTGIFLIGSGYNATKIIAASPYPDAALYCVGNGFCYGISFMSHFAQSYGMHWEAQEISSEQAAGKWVFQNCYFYGEGHAGAGIGMGAGEMLVFDSCHFETTNSERPALYMHNFPYAANNQFAYFNNCFFINNGGGKVIRIENARGIYHPEQNASYMYVSFPGCSSRGNQINYQQDSTTAYSYLPDGLEINALTNSITNGIWGVDFLKRKAKFIQMVYINNAGYGTMQIERPNGAFYCELIVAYDVGGNDITSSITNVQSPTDNAVIITCNNTSVQNNVIQVQLYIMPY